MSPIGTIAVMFVAFAMPFAGVMNAWGIVGDSAFAQEAEIEADAGDADDDEHLRGRIWLAIGAAAVFGIQSARFGTPNQAPAYGDRSSPRTADLIRGPPSLR